MNWRDKNTINPVLNISLSRVQIFLFVSFFVALFADVSGAFAIPNAINYQARLRDNTGAPIAASTTIQFSIYSHIANGSSGDTPSAGGPLLWTETYDQASGDCGQIKPDSQGYFTLTLANCLNFPDYLDFAGPAYYLGVKIGTDAEASPRVKLASHPFALNAERVDGLHATTTATAGQLLALDENKNFNLASGSLFASAINLSSTTATSSISGNLLIIGNATMSTATIANLFVSGISSFNNLNWTNATGTNIYISNGLTVAGNSSFGIISSGTWQGNIIGTAFGGTGTSTLGLAGSLAFSNGSSYAFTAVGTSGQILMSNGAGVPAWISTSTLGISGLDIGGFTAGSIIFASTSGKLSQNNTQFFWDNTNNRLGIGTSTPLATLDLNGDMILSGPGRYINFGTGTGASGYGLRDNAGNIQYKNLGGVWENITTKINHIINVAKQGGDFTELAPAIEYANSLSYDVVINIYPGVYDVSSTIFVTNTHIKNIRGMAKEAVVIRPTADFVTTPGPIFDIGFSASTDFGMRLFTIDGSQTPGFNSTPGCQAINFSTDGSTWMDVSDLNIKGVPVAINMEVENLLNVVHVNIYDIGDTALNIDNGGSIALQSTYIEDVQNRVVWLKSTTGSSTFYMQGSEFGSLSGMGTGIYIQDDASYAELRGSNIWGLEYNIRSFNNSHIYVTASYLERAGVFNIQQNDIAKVTIVNSSGDFSATDISIADSTNVYLSVYSNDEQTTIMGSGTDVDQTLFMVENGQVIMPSLGYKSNYYYGIQGLIYSDLNPGVEGFIGVESTGETASLFASTVSTTGRVQLGLFSVPVPGVYDGIRGWNINRNGTEAVLNFTFINSDVSDAKQYITSTNIMVLDGFNQRLFLDGGALFNTSSGAYDFQVKSVNDTHALFVQGSSDNVGVGTSTPDYKLTVNGDLNISGIYRVNGTPLAFLSPGTVVGQTTYWNGSFWAATSSLFISSNGNVGIGTTTPNQALSVIGGVYLATSTPGDTINTLYNQNGILYFNGLAVGSNVSSTALIDSDGDTSINIETSPDEDMIRFKTAAVQRMIIDQNGRIAVGTSTQSNKNYIIYGDQNSDVVFTLENINNSVSSTAEFSLFNNTGKLGGLTAYSSAWNNGLPGIAGSLALLSYSDLFISTMGSGGDIIFDVDPNDTARSLTILGTAGANAGYVGIATSTPLAPLDVYGDVMISGVNRYLNFGTVTGSLGYGIRDNNGIFELRNSVPPQDSWAEIVALQSLVEKNIIYVSDASGNDAFLGDSIARPKKTIGAAITTATASTTATSSYVILVAPGTYNENLTMADYVHVKGSGGETVLTGDVTFNINTSSILSEMTVKSTNTSAVKVIGSGKAVLARMYLEATYTNDAAAIQSVIYQDKGILEAEVVNQYKLIKNTNTAGAKVETIFHGSGSSIIRSYMLNANTTVSSIDGDNDISLSYIDNTNAMSVSVVKDVSLSVSIHSLGAVNIVKTAYHNGASLNSYWDNNFITVVAPLASTVSLIPAYNANSLVTSTIRIANSSFIWSGVGTSDDRVYLSAAVTDKDIVVLSSNNFSTVSDIFPLVYETDGASGTIDYFISNGHGNLQNKSFTTFEGSFGIGTSTPYDRLEIWGTDLSTGPTSSRNYITIVANGNGEAGNYIRRVNSGSFDNGWSWYMGASSTDLNLWDDSIGLEGNDVLTIQSGTGFIGMGVGLYEPLNVLHVDGGIYLADTSVATTSFSVYNLGGDLYWNGNLLANASGATANWMLSSHNGATVLTTSNTLPVWIKDTIYASSSLYLDGTLNVRGLSYLNTTTISDLTVDNINVLGTVSTTNILVASNITLGGVTRNTWPAGGGGASIWVTTTQNILYPSLPGGYAVVIGNSATSSNVMFEVAGNSKLGGTVLITGAITGQNNLNISGTTTLATTTVTALAANSLTISGLSSLQGLTFTNATGSILVATNYVTSSQLFVTNTSTLSGAVRLGSYAQFTTVGNNNLYFRNTTSTYLRWDNTQTRFELSHGLNILGLASSTALIVNGNATTTGNYYIGGALVLNATGTFKNILPLTDNTYNIGSPALRWAGVNFVNATGSAMTLSNITIASGTAGWTIGTNAFPNAAGSTGLIGLNLTNSSTWKAGLFSEVNGQLISYGINTTQIGDRNTSSIGAIFRLDTRANTPYWSIKRQPIGFNTEFSDMQIGQSGRIGFGGHANDTNDFLGQVHILSAASTTASLIVQGSTGQTADLLQWRDSASNILGVITKDGSMGLGTSTPNSFLMLQTNTTSVFSIVSTTGEKLLEAKNLSRNFGMTVEAGAFISLNTYVGEEFSRERANINSDGAYVWGDYQQFGVDENTTCTWNTQDDTVNGVGVQQNNANSSCLAFHAAATNNAHLIFDADNLPVMLIKAYPANVSANARLWLGLSDLATARNTDPNSNGIYFTNNPTTGDWRAVTLRAGSQTNVECVGQAVATDRFSLLKTEVISTDGSGGGSVKFYVDNDTTDGVQWTYCGESTTNIPSEPMTSMIMSWSNAASNLYIDYYRVWQDDSTHSMPNGLEIISSLEEATPEDEAVLPELTIEERISLAESSIASNTISLINLQTNLEIYKQSADVSADNLVVLKEDLNVLDVSLENTKLLLAALTEKVATLETGLSINNQTILDLSVLITDLDARLVAMSSSTMLIDNQTGSYYDLSANILQVQDLAIFKGSVQIKDHTIFGEDTVGQAIILAGHTSTTITFANPYLLMPVVNVTALDFDGRWKLSETATTGFKIILSEINSTNTLFNWSVFGTTLENKLFVSDGTYHLMGLKIDYVPNQSVVSEVIIPEVVSEPATASTDEEPVVILETEIPPTAEEPVVPEAPEPVIVEETIVPEVPMVVEEPVVEEEAPAIAEESVVPEVEETPVEIIVP
jgi:hypothetical protein